MTIVMACALLAYLVSMVGLYMGIEVVRPASMPVPLENEPSDEMLDLFYELSSEDVDVSEYDLSCELSVTETLILMTETLPFEDVIEMGCLPSSGRPTFVLRLPAEHPWAN